MEFVSTGSVALDRALGGGLAKGALTQVFGEKGIGKSLLALQTACSVVAKGRSVVIIDTEQSYSHLLGWLPAMESRFKRKFDAVWPLLERTFGKRRNTEVKGAIEALLAQLKLPADGQKLKALIWLLAPEVQLKYEKADEPALYIISTPYMQDLLHMHGIRAEISSSAGGRVEVRMLPGMVVDATVSPIGSMLEDVNAELLVYDSLTMPFKSTFVSTQDLPARSATLAMLLSQAQRLCNAKDMAVLAINHVSDNPSNPYDRARPFGGRVVGYDFKFSYHLANASKPKDEEQKRVIIAYRHLLLPPYTKTGEIVITGEGIV